MNITVEDIAACRKRLKIEVPADRVNQAMKKVAGDFQKMAKIPGFRPGKAPMGVVEKKYTKEIAEEVKRSLVPESYQAAVKERGLKVVAEPEVEELNFQPGLSLSFSAILELAPEFVLPEYKGLPVKKAETEVTDTEVDEAVENMRAQRAEFEDVDPPRPSALEDFAVIGYTGRIDGKPITDIEPKAEQLGENPNFWLLLKDDAFLPGFAQEVVGLSIGDRKEITCTIPDDFQLQTLAGKTAVFQVEVKEIKIRKLPELNDALAQEIAKMNLEEMMKALRENMHQQKTQNADRDEKEQILKHLIGAVNFDLPEKLVTEETNQAMYEIVAENQQRGIPAELLEEKKEEIHANAQKSARDQVKIGFIANAIAEKEKIEIDQNEFGQRLAMLASQQQVPIEKFVEQARENGALGQVRERMLLQKVLDFLLQNAKVE